MKKETKVTKEREQTRTTIPKAFVDQFDVTTDDSIEWNGNGKNLKGVLRKNDK